MAMSLAVFFVWSLAIFLLIPTDAFAWGPGLHVEMALKVLATPSLAAAAIAKLITAYPDDFTYGVASPDIIVGKKYAGYHYHCHNWRMGRLILAEAESDRQRAAAYGYLMHLAMDVVAHNYYIPYKIVRSHSSRLLSHVYWEMRFDLGVPEEAWKVLDRITRYEIDEFDELLERVLRKTLFSFSTNKKIFNSILILQKMRGVRKSLKLYASRSRWELADIDRQHYAGLTWKTAIDFLADSERAPCLSADPAGLKRLADAKGLRRRIRAMRARGILSSERTLELVKLYKVRLKEGLFTPDIVLPDVVDVI